MIGSDDFALDVLDFDTPLLETISKLPRMNSIDGQIVLKDLYESQYHIFDHIGNNNNRPLASVALHPGEEVVKDSLLEEIMRSYILKDIKKITGLSLIEYMDLPPDYIEIIDRLATEEEVKKYQEIKKAEKQFQTP